MILLVIGFYSWFGFPAYSHGSQWFKFPLYLASFAIGSLMSSIPPPSNRLFPIAFAGVLAGIVCLVVFHLSAVSLAISPLLFYALSGSPGLSNFSILQALGRQSGSIYVWHTPLLLPAFTLIGEKSGIPSLANYLGSMILCIGTCVFLRNCLERIWPLVFQNKPPKWLTL